MAKAIPPETFAKYVEEVRLVADFARLEPKAVEKSRPRMFVLRYCLNTQDRPYLLHWALLASERDRVIWDGLKQLAREYLRSDPIHKRISHLLAPDQLLEPRMPDSLAHWLDENVLSGKAKRPVKLGTPRKTWRDDAIVVCIDRLAKGTGLPRLRDVEGLDSPAQCCAEGGSTADVVGVAAGILPYQTILAIWKKRGGRKPFSLPP